MGSKRDFEVSPQMVAAAKDSAAKIAGSKVFFLVWDGNSVIEAKDVVPLIQMGLAMYMNKPVLLLVPEGAEIPENILMVAKKIEYFTPGDTSSVQAATTRLIRWYQDQAKDAEAG